MITGEYKEVPTGFYWNDVVVSIPNGAKDVKIIHNGRSTFAGMELKATKRIMVIAGLPSN